MLRLMAIEQARERYRCDTVRLYGAPRVVAVALGHATRLPGATVVAVLRAVIRGAIARAALARDLLALRRTVGRVQSEDAPQRDVLLQGYWDWSVRPNGNGSVRDRYFTDLPSELARRGLTVGWLASCETQLEPWQQGRHRREVIAAAAAHPEVTLLERYWTPADIVRTVCRLRYPLRLTRFVVGRRFTEICRAGSMDLAPVVREQLLRQVWGSTFCRLELIAAAAARACRDLRPRVVLTFMELFLRARAIYAGVSASPAPAAVWAAQHAGYSSDKTLGVVDPDIEMRGRPDGCAMPAPDGIFVMGDLSRRLWEATGLGPARVVPTGGLRYQSVQIRPPARRAAAQGATVLLACGMNESAERELCDAAVSAADGVRGVRLLWRDHPVYQFSRRPAFRPFRDRIVVTSRPLAEDLEEADLVLFTHAGIAEEALLLGIPVWQWLWAGFNTSPFLDVPVIPAFSSARALRGELERFVHDPAPYRPTAETQRRILHECFGTEPAAASARIADAVQRIVRAEVA
jgi:surface carbohydrate biosynthesis protein (TIGR04326 family)